jgi:putative DNA methylase
MKKKLIEVALPLEAINKESAREKSIRHGHPSTLHLWWARRPLAACRAVLFASLVDDPSSHPEQFPTEADQDRERQRLFRLLEELVKWDNSNNRNVLDAAHAEILKSTGGNPPPIYDPFCGGGSIPLEAQRLGLEAHGSDLNPVAVLITKALIELPPKFAGRPPVNPAAKKKIQMQGAWPGARGLADDVRYYGQWMRDRAEERIGHLYPKVKLSSGEEATAIAWIWARTVECPNPACGARMPLVRSFALSTKTGKKAWVEPVVDHSAKAVRFEIRAGAGMLPAGTVNRRGAKCIVCGNSVPLDHVRAAGKGGRMSAQLMAIVAEGQRGRIYMEPNDEHVAAAADAQPTWSPETNLPEKALGFRVQAYGMSKHSDLFTLRQLLALTTFCDLVAEARQQAIDDGAAEYADAVATYLAMVVSKSADYWSNLCIWRSDPKNLGIGHVFARQAVQMVWDFAEGNPFSSSSGNWLNNLEWIPGVLERLDPPLMGSVRQLDAVAVTATESCIFSTDPPYYDNIGYADLSDFFYIWLRKALASIYPDLFSTLLVPKAQELVAAAERFGGDKHEAQRFFETGFARAFARMRTSQDPSYPLTVFYAFKQSEAEEDDENGPSAVASTGWETMLEGLMQSDFQITGTWPSRSELGNRVRSFDSNALASSIVLVCRARPQSAGITTRKDFIAALKRELPHALRDLQQGNIAPVDLAQAAIGPGMAVFSRYRRVLETDGSAMPVRKALALINQMLDEVLSEQESEFDAETRWALLWFEQHQFDAGEYGTAEVLATAKAVSVKGMEDAGILSSRAGKVRLLRREELPEDWDPANDSRLTVWSVTQNLIHTLAQHGESETAILKTKIGGLAHTARDLAYRLYTLCERKGWAEEAGFYNSLVISWPSISPDLFQ